MSNVGVGRRLSHIWLPIILYLCSSSFSHYYPLSLFLHSPVYPYSRPLFIFPTTINIFPLDAFLPFWFLDSLLCPIPSSLPTHPRFLTSHSYSVLDFPLIFGSWLPTHPLSWLSTHLGSWLNDFPFILCFWLLPHRRFLTSHSSSIMTSHLFSVLDFPLILGSWLPPQPLFLTSTCIAPA